MKVCVKCNTEKSTDAFGKDVHKSDGLNSYCKQCCAEYAKQYRKENKATVAEYKASIKDRTSEYNRQYKQNNLASVAKNEAKRRASKLNATPAWLTEDDDFIFNEIYEMAKLRSENTGVEHHVDHIVPLQGIEANGLHVWWNLQIIPASENLSKSNKL